MKSFPQLLLCLMAVTGLSSCQAPRTVRQDPVAFWVGEWHSTQLAPLDAGLKDVVSCRLIIPRDALIVE
jgi:hypothetical protein